jgi:hypothetical protein
MYDTPHSVNSDFALNFELSSHSVTNQVRIQIMTLHHWRNIMSTSQKSQRSSSPQELESALPGLIAKLQDLQSTLSEEEKVVFSEIIESAALHTQEIESDQEGRPRTQSAFNKPPSVYSTTKMRQKYMELPKLLGAELDKKLR